MSMNYVFETVKALTKEFCNTFFAGTKEGQNTFEYAEGLGAKFSELLYADDTLLFAARGHPLDALLWAVECVSGAYGLNLKRSKCVPISINHTCHVSFCEGSPVPLADKTECLG